MAGHQNHMILLDFVFLSHTYVDNADIIEDLEMNIRKGIGVLGTHTLRKITYISHLTDV